MTGIGSHNEIPLNTKRNIILEVQPWYTVAKLASTCLFDFKACYFFHMALF